MKKHFSCKVKAFVSFMFVIKTYKDTKNCFGIKLSSVPSVKEEFRSMTIMDKIRDG